LAAGISDQRLVAEGDSWFDYPPGTDLIDCLRYLGYRIDNFARLGDTLENMVYGNAVGDDYQPAPSSIDQVLMRIGQLQPPVFLFSAGGNDVAGDEFESYLNHRDSGRPHLREDFLDFMVGTIFRGCYETLIRKVEEVSPNTYIVTHGYGHTLPTGKGVSFLFHTWVGPWLLPALAKKRITDLEEQKQIVNRLINALNDLLADLTRSFQRFIYVDLRPLLDPYTDWVNELHLKNSAYARAADEIDRVIRALL
jgi:uncharacterized coiled-coil protein SlyX